MKLDVGHLEMVRAIQEEGTLTGASRRLLISQPALSRQLAKLERRLGAPLFRRHAQGMTLTLAGSRLLDCADRVLSEIEGAEHDVQLLAQGSVGSVRVSTECYMCYHWLPAVTRVFSERFPRVEVQLVPEATRDPYGALERSAVDLALVYSAPSNGAAVERTELFRDELVAVLAMGHARAEAPHLTPEDFRDETLLCHYAEPGRGVLEEAFLAHAGVRPRRTLELQVTPAVIEMARAGYGVAVVPRWILEAQSSLDGLAVLPLGAAGLWRTWYAAWSAARCGEPVLASFVDTLRDAMRRGGRAEVEGSRIRLA